MKHDFKKEVAKRLDENNVFEFRELIREKLNKAYIKEQKKVMKSIVEEIDPELAIATEIESAAKSFGGYDSLYDQGVLEITVPGKGAALDFAAYLDSNSNVDNYEVSAEAGDSGSPVDLEDETGGDDAAFLFTIYMVTSFVTFDPVEIEESAEIEDDEEDETEEDEAEEDEIEENKGKKCIKESNFLGIVARKWLTEAEKTVVFRDGKKKVKMQCPPGQKWDVKQNKCVVIDAAERRRMHQQGISTAKKIAGKLAQIVKKRNRTLVKRTAAGY